MYHDAADLTVNLLSGDPRTIVSLQGLCTLLRLCRVNKAWSRMFSCHEVDFWRASLAYVRAQTRTSHPSYHGASLLPSEEAVGFAVASASTDMARAGVYKRAVMTFVIYRLANGPTVHKSPTDNFPPPTWLMGQVETYMTRKNGSSKNIVKEIVAYWKQVRGRHVVPPIPVDLIVRLLYFCKQCTMQRYQTSPHLAPKYTDLSDLIAVVRKTQWY